MASLNGAKVLGVEHQKGILAVGKDADIVAMQQDFQVALTIAGGEIKHSTLTPQ
jgi:N-acetylglucosamine-6-phosphate deacetylase